MKIASFEDVVAWKEGREQATRLFTLLSKVANYSYKDQMFRAALSVTNNIAEGFERGSSKELRRFLEISRGSNAEVRSMLYTALDCKYLNQQTFDDCIQQNQTVGRLLTGFIKKLSP